MPSFAHCIESLSQDHSSASGCFTQKRTREINKRETGTNRGRDEERGISCRIAVHDGWRRSGCMVLNACAGLLCDRGVRHVMRITGMTGLCHGRPHRKVTGLLALCSVPRLICSILSTYGMTHCYREEKKKGQRKVGWRTSVLLKR